MTEAIKPAVCLQKWPRQVHMSHVMCCSQAALCHQSIFLIQKKFSVCANLIRWSCCIAKGLGVVVFNIEFCHYDNTPMLCSFSCFQNKQTNQKQQRIVTQSRNTKGEEWGWLGESFAHCERLWEELFVYGQLHLSGWDALPRRMKGCHKTKRSQCCGEKNN